MSSTALVRPRLLALLGMLLVVAAVLATWLGWIHVAMTQGVGGFAAGCDLGPGLDCAQVHANPWSELRGVPISLWALPLYGVMGWMAAVGRRRDLRGARARGALVVLAAFILAVSLVLLGVMVLQVGQLCLYCLGLDLLHLLVFLLALRSSSPLRPALPEGVDRIAALIIVIFLMGFSFQAALIGGAAMDRAAVEGVVRGLEVPAGIEVSLTERPGRVIPIPEAVPDVPTDPKDPSLGPISAKVRVITFADFECGHCRRLAETLAILHDRYKDEVRFTFKHFPLDTTCNGAVRNTVHPHACAAARAAVCAARQQRFWPFHDQLFRNQSHLEEGDLRRHAEAAGLDLPTWSSCLQDVMVGDEVIEDTSHGAFLGLDGTPRTFVNGRRFDGAVPEAVLDAAIRYELGQAELTEDGRLRTTDRLASAEAPAPGPAPMVKATAVHGDFFIDAVESSLDGEGRALATFGAAPAVASLDEARAACVAAGKRLCSTAEWVSACQGVPAVDQDGSGNVLDDMIEGRAWPYADGYRADWCHTEGDRERQGALATGLQGTCCTPEGAFDLSGNLQEWVEDGQLMGGTWFSGEVSSCTTATSDFGSGFKNRATGFRCCADSPVALNEAAIPVKTEAPGLQTGQSLPSFQAVELGGADFDSASTNGRVVLLTFWASWCAPCRVELPALAELQALLANEDLVILAVNVDKERALAAAALSAPLPFPVLLDPKAQLSARFDVMAMPTTLLFDRQGHLVLRREGFQPGAAEELSLKVSALLAAP